MSEPIYRLTDSWLELVRIERESLLRGRYLFGKERFARFIASGKRFTSFAMAGVFEPKEKALVGLALNDATSVGEQHHAAVALIKSLRKRGVRREMLLRGSEFVERAREPRADNLRREVFRWGKFMGCRVDSVRAHFLRF